VAAVGETAFDLELIPGEFRDAALARLVAGNGEGWLFYTNNMYGLELVWRNFRALRERGLYEQALLTAYQSVRTNTRGQVAEFLFCNADKAKLRSLGAPLPHPGPFRLYRGVAGKGRARNVRGLSWTESFDVAKWFAERFARPDCNLLASPAVFEVTVPESAVLAYLTDRKEEEFIVLLEREMEPRRVWPEKPKR
jgi:hypothetical protein